MPKFTGIEESFDVSVRWWWRNRAIAWVLRKVFRRVDPRDAYQVRLMLDGLIRRDVQ